MLGRAKHQAREEGRKCLRSTQAGNIPLAPRGEREREQSSPTLEGGSTKAMCASITTASRGSGRGRPGGLCSHPATRAISHSSNTLVTRGEREREQLSPTPEGGSANLGGARQHHSASQGQRAKKTRRALPPSSRGSQIPQQQHPRDTRGAGEKAVFAYS